MKKITLISEWFTDFKILEKIKMILRRERTSSGLGFMVAPAEGQLCSGVAFFFFFTPTLETEANDPKKR